MSNDTVVAIVRVTASAEVKTEDALEDRFRAAFVAVQGHWAATKPDDQYRGAIEAVYLTATDEEKERIEVELASVRDLNALLEGVPIDFDRITKPENPIGLMRLWHEVCDA